MPPLRLLAPWQASRAHYIKNISHACRDFYQKDEVPSGEYLHSLYFIASARRHSPWGEDPIAASLVLLWHEERFGWTEAQQDSHRRLLHCFKEEHGFCKTAFARLDVQGPPEHILLLRSCPDYRTAHPLLCGYEKAGHRVTPDVVAALLQACSAADVDVADALYKEAPSEKEVAASYIRVLTRAGRFEEVAGVVQCVRDAGAGVGVRVLTRVVEAVAAEGSPLEPNVALDAAREAQLERVASNAFLKRCTETLADRGVPEAYETVCRALRRRPHRAASRTDMTPDNELLHALKW